MRDHGLLHSLPRLAGACALMLLAGAPTPAREPRSEEALLWVRSGERLLALDLETGREVSEEELDGASSLLRDPQGLGFPILSTPAGLRDLASGAELRGPDVGLGRGRFSGEVWRVLTGGRLERLSKGGALEQSEALSVGDVALALTDDALWLARGSEILRRGLGDGSESASRLRLGNEVVADCVDPLTGNLVAAFPAGVAWLAPDGSLAAWAHLTGVVGLACGTDGAPLALLPDRVLRLRTLDTEVESEEAVRLPPDLGMARWIEADPRDGAIVVAAGAEILRWTPDGSSVWRIRTEDPVAGLAAGWPERRSPRAAGRPEDRPQAQSQKSSPPPPSVGPEAPDVDPDQIVFVGRVVDPSWQPVEAADVVAFGRDVARTTTAADGTFELPALPYQSGDAVLVQASKPLTAGTATSFPATFTGTPGTTQSVGDRMADFGCPVNFDAGLFPANELNNEVHAITVFDDGGGPAVYVGGTFTTAGGITANRVARWDGSGWSALGSGLGGGTSPSVDALLVFDDGSGPALYAGGKFTTSGAAAVKYVARWTGSQWVQVGNALNNQVLALAGFDSGSGPALYATGSFTKAGSTTVNRIARLSGSTWVTMGSGLNNTGRALASYGGQLHVGGSFTTAGGVSAARIARWNGSAWSTLGSGVSGGSSIQVDALATWDDGTGEVLVAGGRFNSAGGSTVNHIARWDGSSWSSFDTGLAVLVDAVAAIDDGFGPSLYAAGTFTGTPDAGTLNRVARWSGFGWTPIGENSVGVNGSALALAAGTVDGTPGLFLGGAFTSADGTAAGHLARIVRPNDCTDYSPPRLEIVDPSPGETVATTTPAIRVGFADFGSGADTATLAFTANGQPFAASCSFGADVADCVPTGPLHAGTIMLSATLRDLAGNTSPADSVTFAIGESDPPTISISQPSEGAQVADLRPALTIDYADAGSGVDPGTLAIVWNGGSIPLDCSTTSNQAICVPTADQPTGPVSLSATVADFSGNSSAPATRSFEIVPPPPPPSTTFAGNVRFEDGSPAASATVWLADRSSVSTTTAADGTFTLADVELADASAVELEARLALVSEGDLSSDFSRSPRLSAT